MRVHCGHNMCLCHPACPSCWIRNERQPQFCAVPPQATRNVADLAAAMGKLRAFVHLSTAYVNCDRPRGSHVEEALYPLDLSACRPQGVTPI